MDKIGEDVGRAARLLSTGEVVAIPTETVYGLAGNALDPTAVAKIFAVKKRPAFNPLIVHTNHLTCAQTYVRDMPKVAQQLAERFWPGPLTLLLPKSPIIPDIVTAGLERVALRVPQHPLAQALLTTLDFPLAAPSANPFGYVSPTQASHVADQLGNQIPYILDGGVCSIGVESTIVGFEEGRLMVYRWGGITAEQIEQVVGKGCVVEYRSVATGNPQAPGTLKSHYSPRQQVVLGSLPELLAKYPTDKTAVISFQKTYQKIPASRRIVLSAQGDLTEAAHRLFAALRTLEAGSADYILAEFVPEIGLGRAINDRLRRAAATSNNVDK